METKTRTSRWLRALGIVALILAAFVLPLIVRDIVVDIVAKTASRPTATPEPTAAATLSVTGDLCEMKWKPGQIRQVPAGCTVSGDVQVATGPNGPWIALYDNNQDTGLVVNFGSSLWIKAPWGASANASPAEWWVDAMKVRGCAGSCSSVVVLYCSVDSGRPNCH